MTQYIVEQSLDNPNDWYVTINERFEGPYQSLEVANSWAVWFALYDLGLWLLNRNTETAEIFAKKVNDEVSLFLDFIDARKADAMHKLSSLELSAETTKQKLAHQSYFDEAEFVITLAEPAPIPVKQPEAEKKPGQTKTRNSGLTLDRD